MVLYTMVFWTLDSQAMDPQSAYLVLQLAESTYGPSQLLQLCELIAVTSLLLFTYMYIPLVLFL